MIAICAEMVVKAKIIVLVSIDLIQGHMPLVNRKAGRVEEVVHKIESSFTGSCRF